MCICANVECQHAAMRTRNGSSNNAVTGVSVGSDCLQYSANTQGPYCREWSTDASSSCAWRQHFPAAAAAAAGRAGCQFAASTTLTIA